MSNDLTRKWPLMIPDELSIEAVHGSYVLRSITLDTQERLELDRDGTYRWEQEVISVVDVARISHSGRWNMDSNEIILNASSEIPKVFEGQLTFRVYVFGDRLILISSAHLDDVEKYGPQHGNIYEQHR